MTCYDKRTQENGQIYRGPVGIKFPVVIGFYKIKTIDQISSVIYSKKTGNRELRKHISLLYENNTKLLKKFKYGVFGENLSKYLMTLIRITNI
ncbi:hypothetical protein BH23THE1_BH23THE1_19030 [soil metagenome]